MEKNKEVLESVDVIDGYQYQEIMNQKGFINNHRWECMSKQRMHILKLALDAKTKQPVPDMLPSWVFVQDLLGIKLSIPTLGVMGDYEYNTTLGVKENIDILLPQVKEEELKNSVFLKEDELSNAKEVIDSNYEMYKENFILSRTTMKLINYTQVSSNFNKFRSGILNKALPSDEVVEAKKKLRDYYKIISATIEAQFIKTNPTASKDIKSMANQLNKYEFKNSPMNQPAKDKAITFACYSNLVTTIEDGKEKKIEAAVGETKINSLASFAMNEQKFKKILTAEKQSKIQSFDVISIELFYNNQDNKMQAGGTDLEITASDVTLPENKVFEIFEKAIMDTSYLKCYGMTVYELSDFESQAMEWLANNAQYIAAIPGETKEKLNQSILAMVKAESEAKSDAEEFVEGLKYESEPPVPKTVEETTPKVEEVAKTEEISETEEKTTDEIDAKTKELIEKSGLTEEQYKELKKQGIL